MRKKTPAEQVMGQQARADHIEQLFQADGRDCPLHPKHGLFTGLGTEREEPLPVVITEEGVQ